MDTNQPLLFLDIDDVLVLNRPGDFGGYDVLAPDPPPELWQRLIHRPAAQILLEILDLASPRVVITSSWLRFMPRETFERMFVETGLVRVGHALHAAWEAPPLRGEDRCCAIDTWLVRHHAGEPYAILDDDLSGTGLRSSVHDRDKRVTFCEVGIGLHRGHMQAITSALALPLSRPVP